MKKKLGDTLWDLWCICSVIGIWPRFIEPNTVSVTSLPLEIQNLPKDLDNLKILQISDLHLNPGTTDYFLGKLKKKIEILAPDIIVFTGDFLCYARFPDKERLKYFFSSLPQAPYGNYAILGNHDYQEYALVNESGDYDVKRSSTKESIIKKGFDRLFSDLNPTGQITEKAKKTPLNQELVELIEETPFRLLHNETIQVPVNGATLNICGLGEYMLGRMLPDEAYKNYDPHSPGLILVHNPDGVPHLTKYPGDLILCGHSHGGQINLPWVWRKFVVMENLNLKKGLVKYDGRYVYINRGLGGVLNFRWFCLPELTLITLRSPS